MDAAYGFVTPTLAARPPEPRPQIAPPSPPSGASERPNSFGSEIASQLTARLTAQRTVERDDATGSLVYRLIDLSTGLITVQTPSDARLRLRAYIDGVIASASERGFEATA